MKTLVYVNGSKKSVDYTKEIREMMLSPESFVETFVAGGARFIYILICEKGEK